MVRWVLFGLAVLCMVQGLVQLIGMLSARLLCPKECRCCCTLLPVSGQDEQIELKLLWAGFCLRWGWQRGPLVLLDLGLQPETRTICCTYCREHEWACLLTPAQLAEKRELAGVYKTFRGVLY